MINRFNDLRKQSKYHVCQQISDYQGGNAWVAASRGSDRLGRFIGLRSRWPLQLLQVQRFSVRWRRLSSVDWSSLDDSTLIAVAYPLQYRPFVSSLGHVLERSSTFRSSHGCLLLLIPGFMSAQQSVTLDKKPLASLWRIILRLKTAELAIQQAKASRGENFEAQPTSFNYQWGQINSDNKHDKQYNLEQNLGSLITPYYKNVLVNAKVKSGTYYRTMVEKEVTAEVKRAWAYYQYAANLCALYRDQEKMANGFARDIADRQFKAEKSPCSRRTWCPRMLPNCITNCSRHKRRRCHWHVSVGSCYADAHPAYWLSSLSIFYAPKDSVGLSEAHLAISNSQADVMKAMVNVEKSHFFRRLAWVTRVRTFCRWRTWMHRMVGVSFPIIFWPQSSKGETGQDRCSVSAPWPMPTSETSRTKWPNYIVAPPLQWKPEPLQRFGIERAQQLLNSAKLQLQNNETSIADYILSVSTARDIQRNYIETVYQYNIAALKYELYKW